MVRNIMKVWYAVLRSIVYIPYNSYSILYEYVALVMSSLRLLITSQFAMRRKYKLTMRILCARQKEMHLALPHAGIPILGKIEGLWAHWWLSHPRDRYFVKTYNCIIKLLVDFSNPLNLIYIFIEPFENYTNFILEHYTKMTHICVPLWLLSSMNCILSIFLSTFYSRHILNQLVLLTSPIKISLKAEEFTIPNKQIANA